jgi:2-C-methyl-D-erythritol 4-phosphate cytidylyltransferase
MRVVAIVLAAGRGLRFKNRTHKPLVKIGSRPVLIYSLATLNSSPLINSIIVVAAAQNLKKITSLLKQYRINKALKVISGGERRQDSLGRGLAALEGKPDLVLIHDAARPFLDEGMISRSVKEAAGCGAAVAGVPVKATIKTVVRRSSSVVRETLDRDKLWEVQTPQVFKTGLILKAYKKFSGLNVTDDAMLVEKSGAMVRLVRGSYRNIKITTPEDLALAKSLCNTR